MEVGATGQATTTVAAEATARSLGSGDVDVLGTPALIALMEAATVDAVADSLSPDSTTVGTSIRVDHTKPNRVGDEVSAFAALESIEGRTLTFAVRAESDGIEVGSGTIRRVVVDRDRFMGSNR
jgi:predicted thioesterase